MKDLISKVASQHGVSEEEVMAELEQTLNAAIENNSELIKSIPCKGDKPTIEELIDHISKQVICKLNEQ